MADLIRKMQEGHTVEDLDTVIDEVYEARGEYDSLGERLDDMEGGAPIPSTSIPAMDGTGSAGTSSQYARADHVHPSDTSKQNTLSSTQLDAVNSGIDSTKVEQIETNKNNILSVANTGRKNVLHFNNNSTLSAAGVVYTINSDGSITADVTGKTGLSYIILMLDSNNADVKQYCTGNYILSGCPSGGGDNTYQMYAASGSYVKRDYGDGVVLTETEQANVYLIIRIESAYSGGNITFKPMIRLVGTDSKFEKWSPSNAELYDMILALQ